MKKHNTIWDKISAMLKLNLMTNLYTINKFLKTTTKFCNDEVIYFINKEVPKADSSYTCLAVISLDFIFGVHEKYHSQVFLKECALFLKESKLKKRYILMILMKNI